MAQGRQLPVNYHSHDYGGIRPPSLLTLWPAYMALPFLRTPLGIHIVSPWRVLFFAGGLFCCQTVFEHWLLHDRVSQPLRLFTVAYVALALSLWGLRWWRQATPSEPHSAEAGYSWLARKLPIPIAITEVIIVPVILAVVGWQCVLAFDFECGAWLMISAGSLFMMALWEFRRSAAQRRAIHDDMVRAGLYSSRVGESVPPGDKRSGRSDDRDFADLG